MDGLDDIVEEFLVESHENLDQLDRDLVALEQEPNSRERLSSIFRTIHTIKGTSGFLAFNRLEKVTHVGENLLVPAAGRRAGPDPGTHQRAAARWSTSSARCWPPSRPTAGRARSTSPPWSPRSRRWRTTPRRAGPRRPAPAAPPAVETVAAPAARTRKAPARRRPPRRPRSRRRRQPPRSRPPRRSPSRSPRWPPPRSRRGGRGGRRAGGRRRAGAGRGGGAGVRGGAPRAGHPADAPAEAAGQIKRRGVADSTIRVDVDLLDKLMHLVGELVLTRNQIVQYVGRSNDTDLVRAAQRLNLITSELQEGVMKTRMQPIDNIWSKLPRVVRDLGAAAAASRSAWRWRAARPSSTRPCSRRSRTR